MPQYVHTTKVMEEVKINVMQSFLLLITAVFFCNISKCLLWKRSILYYNQRKTSLSLWFFCVLKYSRIYGNLYSMRQQQFMISPHLQIFSSINSPCPADTLPLNHDSLQPLRLFFFSSSQLPPSSNFQPCPSWRSGSQTTAVLKALSGKRNFSK